MDITLSHADTVKLFRLDDGLLTKSQAIMFGQFHAITKTLPNAKLVLDKIVDNIVVLKLEQSDYEKSVVSDGFEFSVKADVALRIECRVGHKISETELEEMIRKSAENRGRSQLVNLPMDYQSYVTITVNESYQDFLERNGKIYRGKRNVNELFTSSDLYDAKIERLTQYVISQTEFSLDCSLDIQMLNRGHVTAVDGHRILGDKVDDIVDSYIDNHIIEQLYNTSYDITKSLTIGDFQDITTKFRVRSPENKVNTEISIKETANGKMLYVQIIDEFQLHLTPVTTVSKSGRIIIGADAVIKRHIHGNVPITTDVTNNYFEIQKQVLELKGSIVATDAAQNDSVETFMRRRQITDGTCLVACTITK